MTSKIADPSAKTYLSGVQPSGLQHLGNYFGAIRQHIELPLREPAEHFRSEERRVGKECA